MLNLVCACFCLTQEALFCFIRIIWGMVESGAVPPPPDADAIHEFTSAFSSADQIGNIIRSSLGRDLIPRAEVLTFKNMATGRKKMGHGIINVHHFFLNLTQSTLAKLGIRMWGPNLDESIDSLWNVACWLAALKIFCDMAIARRLLS